MIKFEFDIIDRVYGEFGGMYTKEQIGDVLDASVSYAHHIMRYTDAWCVKIPYIGKMVVNGQMMKLRLRRILNMEKRGPLSGVMETEKEALQKRIAEVDLVFEKRSAARKKMKEWARMLTLKKGFAYVQDFQNKKS